MRPAAADAASYTALLPHHSFDAAGGVFVLDDGSLGIVWHVEAVPCEAASDPELGALAARLDGLIRLLPEGSTAQFITQITRDVRPILDRWLDATRSPEGSILRDLAASRVRVTQDFSMKVHGAPFVAKRVEHVFTIRVFPRWPSNPFAPASLQECLRRAYDAEKRTLLDLADAIENQLTQTGIVYQRMDEDTLVAFVHGLLNGSNEGAPATRPDRLVRERFALASLAFDSDSGVIRVGESHWRVASAAEVPLVTFAGMLTRGAPAVVDHVEEGLVVVNIEVPPQEAVRKSLARKKRLAFCQMGSGDLKVDVAAMKSEVDQSLGEMFLGGRVVSARLHVLLCADRAPDLHQRVSAVRGALAPLGLHAVAEEPLALALFLQALPLAYDPANDCLLKRGRKMMAMNLAHLLPVYGSTAGTRTPDLLLVNRRGEPVTFSFFDSEVAPHGIIAGVTGSGKSVFVNSLILSTARRGAHVFVLDRGNSYRKLCEVLGGSYVAFDPARPLSVNPCGRGLTEEKHLYLTDIVSEMATQGQRELSVKERALVGRAIANAFTAAGDREVLAGDLRKALLSDPEPAARDLGVCLEPFCGSGPYAGFFDRPCAVRFDSPLAVFELGDIARRRDIASVLLMAIIHNVTSFCAGHVVTEKYLVVDEAWTLLRTANTAGFLEDVLRTYRKLNCAGIMVTQQMSDFEGRCGEAIRANAPNRVFLRQTPETVQAMERLLDLSPKEKELLAGLTTIKGLFSEMLLISTAGKGVARLVQDPLTYWITTSDPSDNALLDGLAKKYVGHDDPRGLALREAAARHPHGAGR